jgi:hypothetical protein
MGRCICRFWVQIGCRKTVAALHQGCLNNSTVGVIGVLYRANRACCIKLRSARNRLFSWGGLQGHLKGLVAFYGALSTAGHAKMGHRQGDGYVTLFRAAPSQSSPRDGRNTQRFRADRPLFFRSSAAPISARLKSARNE